MHPVISTLLDSWQALAFWMAFFCLLFGVLTRVAPCNPTQPLWPPGLSTDIIYAFVLPVLMRLARVLFVGAGAYLLFYGLPQDDVLSYLQKGFGPAAQLPVWLQAAVVFVLSDILLYGLHRWFHGKKMWAFHAIHHSPQHVSWHTAYRFHPINAWLSFTLVDAIMALAGFSPAAITAMVGVNTVYSAMVHANVNWTFGPFKYLFASPVFHRWHHTSEASGMNKNFAPTFPLIDIAFGTFYMPGGKLPEHYGVPGAPIPEGFIAQCAWPFTQK